MSSSFRASLITHHHLDGFYYIWAAVVTVVFPLLFTQTLGLCAAVLPYLPAADGLAVTRLTFHSVKVYWTLPSARDIADCGIAFTRVTVAPQFDRYRIMEDFPVPEYSATFANLQPGLYEVSLQSGDREGGLGESGEAVQFRLQGLLPVGQNETIDWSKDPNGLNTATEEIVIVCLVILFWILAIIWFFAKWAKIRVIEPRYFDYKFLMRYDKAFALRNTVISGATGGPRRSSCRSVAMMANGAAISNARFSISAASTRNNPIDDNDDEDDEDDLMQPLSSGFPVVFHPSSRRPSYVPARRPSCLPGVGVPRQQQQYNNHRRPSQDVRIHLNELFEMQDGRLKLARDSISSV
ncbi:hypothetical protein BV898_02271 [Hypsibius exemplaris]|uniref:Fibronectin type III domain-containing protein n=1 Tax=Hypsibius exemplaris TaxID=2072580 RepID=A0A1W0X8U2_HYPEX|nr:hypothetical protein BV898_02271 [Hypsibius exemplaris]